MEKITIILLILVVFVLITGQGCTVQKADSGQEQDTTGTTTQETGTAQESIDDIGQGISDIENMDGGLNLSELENLDKELDEIQW